EIGKNWAEVFWSEIVESSDSQSDKNFAGMYAGIDWSSYFKNFEVYVFYLKDESVQKKENITYGNRLHWLNDSFATKLEYTGQSQAGFQADATVYYNASSKLQLG